MSQDPTRRPEVPLPNPPRIVLSIARDRTQGASASGGFLNVCRLDLIAQYPSGETSAPFPYDMVTRAALDAVVIAAHFQREGVRHVFLRSAVRPPVALRPAVVDVGAPLDPGLWELPAGLVEPGEAPVQAAARELAEELGFDVPSSSLRELGGWMFPAPAVLAERHLYFHVEVDPEAPRGIPTEDGSALERGASILSMPVTDALAHCRRGGIRDGKTELALRRLLEHYPHGELLEGMR